MINDPATVAELQRMFERYNACLDAGDVEKLNSLFWDSPHTVRFGPGENLFGHDAIAAFRARSWSAGPRRELEHLSVTTIGHDFGTTNAVFTSGTGTLSRQTQTWARLGSEWRIISAHVSLLRT